MVYGIILNLYNFATMFEVRFSVNNNEPTMYVYRIENAFVTINPSTIT